jgi:hypothetical protein
MKKNLLENIIRRYLTEAEIVVSNPQVPSSADETKYRNQILTLVNPNVKSEARNVENLGVLQYEIIRKGFPGDTKEFKLSTTELHQYIINQLNQTRGYADKTSLDFSWFLFTDQKKTILNKSKDEKRRAKYVIMAVYVKSNLLTRNPLTGKDVSLSGWVTTLKKGSLVFDYSKANPNWWQKTESDEKATEVLQSNIPLVNLGYADNNVEVRKLVRFFEPNYSNTIQQPNNLRDFDCSMKAMVSQFQEENGIPVTGNWDEKTWKKANELKYTDPANQKYTVKNSAALTQKWNACEIEKQAKEQQIQVEAESINFPSSGKFIKGDKSPEIAKIQVLMVECLRVTNLTSNSNANINKFIELIEKTNSKGEYPNRGEFGPSTETCVALLANYSNQLLNATIAKTGDTGGLKSLPLDNNKIIDKDFVKNLYTIITFRKK